MCIRVLLRRFRCVAAVLVVLVAAAAPAQPPVPTPVPTPSLNASSIPKYVDQLVIPPVMPKTSVSRQQDRRVDNYEIAVRQFQQQILPRGQYNSTTVWSYGSPNHPETFNYPAFTVEATVNKPVRVKWMNQLVDANGNYLPHLFSVDQTLHWANPGGLAPDSHGMTLDAYRGPVPLVTHVHGAHTGEESDGFAEAWYLPDAKNIPAGFFRVGSKYEEFKQEFFQKYHEKWTAGSATFQYPNDQRACTLWYHDHAMGMTRLNVYAGPAGFYLLRGGSTDLPPGILPGPGPAAGDPPGKQYYEIPMAIQDRSFNNDGSLFFPTSRQFFDGIASPYLGGFPLGDISPIWNPEFFGETIVVNGKTWPNQNVEPRRYRFRLLDGCNARSLKLKLVIGNPTDPVVRSGPAALPFWQIGAEQGFLPAPVRLNELLITLAERADVIVDFTGLPVGTKVMMINRGPDEPLNGTDDPEAEPGTTGQVMQFTVVPLASVDSSTPPDQLQLPAFQRLGNADRSRQLSLNEMEITGQDVEDEDVDGPKMALLGTMMPDGMPMPMMWSDPITETPKLGSTEIWEINNFTMDAHPIHLHQVAFEVVDRTPMGDAIGGPTTRPPEPWETGTKDTVIAYPAEVTRLKAKFDIPGLFVWHCHIVDHEDNEMMRPYRVLPR